MKLRDILQNNLLVLVKNVKTLKKKDDVLLQIEGTKGEITEYSVGLGIEKYH